MTTHTVQEMTKSEIADRFQEAITYIANNGWFQGSWFELEFDIDEPRVPCKACMLGALLSTCGETFEIAYHNNGFDILESYVLFKLRRRAFEDSWDDGLYPAEWNDREGRTQSEVMALLVECEEDWRSDSLLVDIFLIHYAEMRGWTIVNS